MTISPTVYFRFNGHGHAFGREVGCACQRCRFASPMAPAPSELREFEGWLDPPERACTSGSLLIGEGAGSAVVDHVLIDMGPGVASSLAASGIPGIGNIRAVLLTHWHPDHICPNALGESLRRHVPDVLKVPLYTTRATYEQVYPKHKYEFSKLFEFREITPGTAFELPVSIGAKATPIPVAHGSVRGACNFAIDCGPRIVTGWDIDLPGAVHPGEGVANLEIYKRHQNVLKGADLYVLPANTFSAVGTGHCSYEAGLAYIDLIAPKKVCVTHMSGHEDKAGNPGFGWPDGRWASELAKNSHELGNQGRVVKLQ